MGKVQKKTYQRINNSQQKIAYFKTINQLYIANNIVIPPGSFLFEQINYEVMTTTKSKVEFKKKTCALKFDITYIFEYYPESKEFKNAFAAFKKNIDLDGDEESMLNKVAHDVYIHGPGIVEGIGYVSFCGIVPKQFRKTYTGIDVPKGLPFPFFFPVKIKEGKPSSASRAGGPAIKLPV